MEREIDPLQRSLLIHLLNHRGQQVRFEADQWTTEFGIFRRFSQENPGRLKIALRSLEMARWIYRRVQYVIGYSEPKLVYSLTPSGHRKAVDLLRAEGGGGDAVDSVSAGPDRAPEAAGDPSSTAPPL
jgi:DNA-binding PadR family transcriptional regulator